jgi:hypothetical protein
MFGKEKEE